MNKVAHGSRKYAILIGKEFMEGEIEREILKKALTDYSNINKRSTEVSENEDEQSSGSPSDDELEFDKKLTLWVWISLWKNYEIDIS